MSKTDAPDVEDSKQTCWTSKVRDGPWVKRQYDRVLQKWGYNEAEQALYNLRQALLQFGKSDPIPDRPDVPSIRGVHHEHHWCGMPVNLLHGINPWQLAEYQMIHASHAAKHLLSHFYSISSCTEIAAVMADSVFKPAYCLCRDHADCGGSSGREVHCN